MPMCSSGHAEDPLPTSRGKPSNINRAPDAPYPDPTVASTPSKDPTASGAHTYSPAALFIHTAQSVVLRTSVAPRPPASGFW